MKVRKLLAGIGCAAMLAFGMAVGAVGAVAPAQAALGDCGNGSWAAWKDADFKTGTMLYCKAGSVNAYSSAADNKATSISNKMGGWVDYYVDTYYNGARLDMPAYFSHNNLKKQSFNDVISSTDVR